MSMNNDLEQFSEERLIEIAGGGVKSTAKFDEQMALARIALAAKQARPVGYLFVSPDGGIAYSISNVEFEGVKLVGPIYSTPQPAHTEQVIPDGWKLVPEEATIAMLTLLGMTGSFEFMQQKYKNMLASAPKPESE